MEISQVVAVITGGASGLGRATAEAIVARGGKVMILDRDAQRAAEAAAELGANADFVETDVTREDSVKAAIARTVEKFGAIHVCVNCAGVGSAMKTVGRENAPHDLGVFETVVKINLIGTFNVLRLAAAAMAGNEGNDDGERGVIVNTSSGAAWQGQMGQAAYSASKAAVMGLTLPVARDLAQHGVRVVALAPGLFETGMSAGMPTKVAQNIIEKVILFPNRMGQAPEFSALVRHVVENAYLNATTLSIDGGARL